MLVPAFRRSINGRSFNAVSLFDVTACIVNLSNATPQIPSKPVAGSTRIHTLHFVNNPIWPWAEFDHIASRRPSSRRTCPATAPHKVKSHLKINIVPCHRVRMALYR